MDATVIQWLIETAPWAATAAVLLYSYFRFTTSRNSQAVELADRAFSRMKAIEDRLDRVTKELAACESMHISKDAELSYQQRVIHWMTDYVNQLHSHWHERGAKPPSPRYPPPPEPAAVKDRIDRAYH